MSSNEFEQEVLRLTNEFRQQNGLQPLVIDQSLAQAADQHSRNMAMQDFFSHTGRDNSRPVDRAEDAGYESGFVGENIAAGYRTPAEVVQGWIDSPGHRANLLNTQYNEIGIGHYYLANDTGSTNYGNYWTQVFGRGTIESPPPSAPPRPQPTPQPTPAPQPTPTPQPTPGENNSAVIQGTDRADRLIGSAKSQRIYGKRGNDVIQGRGGNDRLYGHQGADKLWGNSGNDQLWGNSGNDQLWGGAGNDQLRGGTNNDQLRGGSNNDRLWGDNGNDKLWGDSGNDQLRGGSGNDHLLGGSGNDQLLGNLGSDKLMGGDGNDRLQGAQRTNATEKDVMTGGRGRDTFVVGDRAGSFYDDGNARSMGLNNYALITDLNVSQGDIVQLSAKHKYRLGSSPKGVDSGRALFIDNAAGQPDELIAVIRGSGNLNLNSSTFKLV